MYGLEINEKSKQFMAAGSLKGVQMSLCPSLFCEQMVWRQVTELHVVGSLVTEEASSNRALAHRQRMSEILMARHSRAYRRRLPFDTKVYGWQRQGQASAAYASEVLHINKELLQDAKRWETVRVRRALALKFRPEEGPAAYGIRTALVVRETFKRTGIFALHYRIIRSALKSAAGATGIAASDRAERDMLWRAASCWEPHRRRKVENNLQARPGRRVAWDDWLFNIFGPSWQEKVRKEVQTRSGMKQLVNDTCKRFGLPEIPPKLGLHTCDADHVPEPMGFSEHSPINSLPLPKLHSRDNNFLSDVVQVEFVVDNRLLADVCEGKASGEARFYADMLARIERLMLQGCIPPMFVLPLVSWRPRAYNTLADKVANLTMDLQKDLKFVSPLLRALRPEKGVLLQWHSDGGARENGLSAAACTLTLLRKPVAGDVQRTLLFSASRFLGTEHVDASSAERQALQLALLHMCALWPLMIL